MKKRSQAHIYSVVLSKCSQTKKHVFPHVTFTVKIRWLGNPFTTSQFGKNFLQNLKFPQIFQGAVWSFSYKYFLQLLKAAAARESLDLRSLLAESLKRLGMILTIDIGSQTHRAQKTQRGGRNPYRRA